MNDTKTKLIAELDLSKAQKQLSEFLKETHKTELTLDTSSLKKARDELNSLSKVTIKPKIDLSEIKSTVSTAAGELRQIQDLTSQIGNTKIELGGIDTGKLSTVQSQIRQLQTDYQTLGNTLSKGISGRSTTPSTFPDIPQSYVTPRQTQSTQPDNTSGQGILSTVSNTLSSTASAVSLAPILKKNLG